MRANLAPDEFGSGPEHDQFETSSLYFETGQFDVFHRRGSYGKSKYRVRRYGNSPIMFLERKFRTERVLIKRRTTAALETSGGSNRTSPIRSGMATGFIGGCSLAG